MLTIKIHSIVALKLYDIWVLLVAQDWELLQTTGDMTILHIASG